jgi:hypothetical protein
MRITWKTGRQRHKLNTPILTPATESKDLEHLLPTIFYQIPMHGANIVHECIRFATLT